MRGVFEYICTCICFKNCKESRKKRHLLNTRIMWNVVIVWLSFKWLSQLSTLCRKNNQSIEMRLITMPAHSSHMTWNEKQYRLVRSSQFGWRIVYLSFQWWWWWKNHSIDMRASVVGSLAHWLNWIEEKWFRNWNLSNQYVFGHGHVNPIEWWANTVIWW